MARGAGADRTGEQGAGGRGGQGYTSPGGQGRRSPRSPAQRREERGVPGGFAPREPPAPRIPLSLSSPGNQRRKGVHRWAPGLFPAPLADMAADELSPGSLGSPAARVEETPPPSRPASLGSPLPAGPPATAGHRARAAREDARRAGDHRVHSLEGPSSHGCPWPEAEVREEAGGVVRMRGLSCLLLPGLVRRRGEPARGAPGAEVAAVVMTLGDIGTDAGV